SRNTFNNNYGWRSKVQVFPETGKYENIQFHLSDRQAHILNNGVRLLDVVGQNKFEWQKCVNGNFIFIGPTSARDGTYIISFIKHNSVFKGLLDDVVESTDNSITNMPYYLVFWTQDSAIIRIYYTFVHKYTSPEPTVTISAEQLVSSITLTKSIPSTDLQEATPTTVTLTIKNTGSKPINNLKITDTLPSSFKLVSGSLSKTISSLDAGESTTLEYTFEPVGIGSITLPKAVVTYGDKTASSKSITVNIIAKDSDNDGLSDKQELQLGTDPNSADSDNDGLPDKLEMDQGLNPRLADSDGDGINDKQDIYPLDKDNDGIPDSEDPLPTIPQNYVYAGIGLIILAGLVAVGAFINSQKNKKWKDTFYNALRVDIVPDKESYELDDNMAFTVSVSNNFGDIASGTVESPYFNTISLTRIKSGKVYREKVHIKAKEVGIFNGNATATITDERGNVHKLKESFSVEVTPYIPKLKIKVIGVEKYEPSTN
ncbi:MAG: BatD family protein, partial [Methanosarcinales archaeon]